MTHHIVLPVQEVLSTDFIISVSDSPYEAEPHECDRVCVQGETKRCVYDWTLEWYPTRSKVSYDYKLIK